MRILAKREIKTFYDAGNSYEVENNLENKFYVRTSEVSPELKDLIEEEKIINDEHLIITKKVSLDNLRASLGNLDKVFLAEIERIYEIFINKNSNLKISGREAIVKGISEDGGLLSQNPSLPLT
ncbi:hypothetical protein [Peptoniphilus harei]|uniref:hypothetical protein n=1 Tax=Peptoniphilus harei TaxID=54005 RepID=UPI002114E1D4|nr:hypothetical protein [Peptoniphilus harei]